MAKKEKKEKIVYYDDGSTISDMSRVNGKNQSKQVKKQEQKPSFIPHSKPTSKWKTYWQAVRIMVFPMCLALAMLGILFLCVMTFSRCVGA